MGVKQIQTLQEMPVELLRDVCLASTVERHLEKSSGNRPQSSQFPYQERKSISTERTFEKDTTDHVKLKSILTSHGREFGLSTAARQQTNRLRDRENTLLRFSDTTHSNDVKCRIAQWITT